MRTSFKIHPAIGIARLGDSPTSFSIASETEGGFPIECDAAGLPVLKDGKEQPAKFHDDSGRIRRQAARFGVFVYDDISPDGREVAIGDTLKIAQQQTGQLLTIRVDDIHWTVYLANKKSSWYEFKETAGEHGYGADHKLRNADITDANERQRLIIDPGPRGVAYADPKTRRAVFDDRGVPASFPPALTPNSIAGLGEIRATQQGKQNRLLVLGGFGNSGSMNAAFGNPKIDTYANNDGWFDDVSDGPVNAAFVYTLLEIDGQPAPPPPDPKKKPPLPQIAVDDAAWVIVGYPRYAPEIVDLVTMDDLVFDVAVRDFAAVPYVFGMPPFDRASNDPKGAQAWGLWRRSAQWNRDFHPYFWRDIWPILERPIDYGLVMDKDAFAGGNPHENIRGGNFDETELAIAPFEGEDPADRERRWQKRQFLYGLVRKQGQQNVPLTPPIPGNQDRLFLMPLLCGDNPLSNVAPDKFLRLTDTMTFLLHQWAEGLFIDEHREGIVPEPMLRGPGRAWDRGALASGLGGAFCPGGEAGWIMRNPAIFEAPYRIRHAPKIFGALSQPAAVTGAATAANLAIGSEPGDLTKYSAVPWQSDFNECTNQNVDVTYEGWNTLELDSTGDPAAAQVQLTYWWPAHRPVFVNGAQWSPTSQTPSGDLMMVTAWRALPFLKIENGSIVPVGTSAPSA